MTAPCVTIGDSLQRSAHGSAGAQCRVRRHGPSTSYLPHLNGAYWSPLNQRGLGAAPLFQSKKRPAPPDLGRASQGRCLILIPPKTQTQPNRRRATPACLPTLPWWQVPGCLGHRQSCVSEGLRLSQPQETTFLTTGLWSASRLPPASPDGVTKQTSLWGHGQQKDQFRFYQIFPSCVFYAKTAKNSDLNNSLRILSGVGVREDHCTLSSSSH